MNRFRLRRLLHRIPVLQYVYQFPWVQRLYKRIFVRSLPSPKYCIELVNQCNAECIFCTYPILRDRGKPMMNMTESLFQQSLEFIKSHRRPSISLTPTTGEIFMNPRWNVYLQEILELDFVDDVYFYTNAALLNAKNREKFFELRNLHKVSLSFSTGGIDRETYTLMYGKDLFDHVQQNINDFLACLQSRGITIPISIDVKMPKHLATSPTICQQVYNRCNYAHAFVKLRSSFDTLGGWIQDANLEIIPAISQEERRVPCHFLNDIRFAANGEVWLCGCVISELPDQDSLKVGHLEQTPLPQILAMQQQIQKKWREDAEIPATCRQCTWYAA